MVVSVWRVDNAKQQNFASLFNDVMTIGQKSVQRMDIGQNLRDTLVVHGGVSG